MEEQNHIAGLILKQLQGELAEFEAIELQEWANASQDNQLLYDQLTNPELLQPEVVDFYNSNKRIFEKIKAGISMPKVIPLWKKLTAAASIILVLGFSAYFLFKNKSSVAPTVQANLSTDVIAPSTARAVITLADGTKVYLDSAGSGQLAVQGNIKLVKLSDGQIAYQSSNGEIIKELKYNTLSNPRGSKVIDMKLSDGSHVWLNSGSSITYPVAFVGNDRKVTIEGEAYFEVAHDATKPFIVSKGETSVQVLGTHFNVNAYSDEEEIKVTLLEGSVRVSSLTANSQKLTAQLKPGQQAKVSNDIKLATDVDLDQVMAWKNGWFEFDNTDLQTIMRQISRWYDIEIVYQRKATNEKFGGRITKNLPLSEILELLKSNDIKFKLDGRKLIVNP